MIAGAGSDARQEARGVWMNTEGLYKGVRRMTRPTTPSLDGDPKAHPTNQKITEIYKYVT